MLLKFFGENKVASKYDRCTDLHTHELPTRQPAYTLYHNKMCSLHRGVLDKNSETESHSHTLTCYIFLWIIEGTLYMILK